MPHFFDRLVIEVLGQFAQTPVRAHFRVDEIRVDGRQLDSQPAIERINDLLVALHGISSFRWMPQRRRCAAGLSRESSNCNAERRQKSSVWARRFQLLSL